MTKQERIDLAWELASLSTKATLIVQGLLCGVDLPGSLERELANLKTQAKIVERCGKRITHAEA